MTTAYVLEYLVDNQVTPAVVAAPFVTNAYDNYLEIRMEPQGTDLYSEARLAEFPKCPVDYGDDWDCRLGLGSSEYGWRHDCEACGGALYTTDDAGTRCRIRRVQVSGEPSPEFARWLEMNPRIGWCLAKSF